LREFLYSEIAIAYNLVNMPDNLELAVKAGQQLCENLLEPIQAAWGKVHVRSGFRSKEVNQKGNSKNHNCASNAANFGAHIWDEQDANGYMGATACIVLPEYLDYFNKSADWMSLAWWVHHNIPDYTELCFFKNNCAFNIRWSENPAKQQRIKSFMVNKDTGDKTALVSKGNVNQHYNLISPVQRFQACTDLLH